jgi:hypothetical protein
MPDQYNSKALQFTVQNIQSLHILVASPQIIVFVISINGRRSNEMYENHVENWVPFALAI